MEDRVRVREVRVLSDDWYLLKKTTLDYRRRDGSWQTFTRETYDRGNGAAILLYDPQRRTVLLTRQFRFPAYVNGHPQPLIEVPAGLLDELSPEEAIRREAEEEAGCRIGEPRRLFGFQRPRQYRLCAREMLRKHGLVLLIGGLLHLAADPLDL